ncbi:MAG TPA: AMP-binding protein [Geminicoccaceae bacterium]
MDGLARRGEATALLAYGRDARHACSYRELGRRSRALAAGLIARGLRSGEVVGLIAPDQPDWVVAFLGIVRAGGVAMPLSEQVSRNELRQILPHAGCHRLITTARHAQKLDRLPDGHDVEIVLIEAEGPLERAEPPPGALRLDDLAEDGADELPSLEPDRTAALLYTSGTTGTPKGVPLTHANLCSNIEALLKADMAGPDDRLLLPLPLYHTYPLTVGLLAPLTLGATVVLPGGITGPQVRHALEDGRCTIMVAVPRLYEALLGGVMRQVGERRLAGPAIRWLLDLAVTARRRMGWNPGRFLFAPLRRRIGPSLRLLASGGARLDPEVGARLQGLGFEVLTGYGLTETSPILTFNPPGRAKIASAGLPVEGVELRIDRDQGREPGQGEIQARGPNVFEGYFENPEATAEAFTGDGFFRTGDLGFLDQDGYLHIAGRSKELIVLSGGKNIFPDEVEAVYGESGLIKEMAVLEHDGRLAGLFVPTGDLLQDAAPEEVGKQIRGEVDRLSPRLPSHARISDFAVTARSLPRTQIGKLRRHELPAMFEEAKAGGVRDEQEWTPSDEDRSLLDTPPAGEVWTWLNERFEGRRLTLDSSPQLDLGLDSFDWMTLTMELEERFGVRLEEEALARVQTLRDLLLEVIDAGGGEVGEPGGLSEEQARFLEPEGPWLRAVGRVLFELNRLVMRTVFRLRVEGRDRLPDGGAYLIAPNHASFLDPFVLAAALSFDELQRIYWAGWTGILFRGPLTRLFSRITHVVPVDPKRGLTSTLALGRGVLERGLVLVWFPEGQRTTDGRLRRFLPGAGWLIDKTGAEVVPAWIDGTYLALPPHATLPRPARLGVRFGRPLRADDLGRELAGAERHASMAERMRTAVEDLSAG